MTKHFNTIGASGMSCKFCEKTSNRGFNLRRHEKEYCPLNSEEREMSGREKTVDSEDDASSVATDGSESPMTGDSETEPQEEADPWKPMAEEAMQKHEATFQEMEMNLTHSGPDEQSLL